uniref:Sulfatase-modifying factor enzyme-like domain-containing protein n=1 Tax=Sus scrofa TaxID=9823 RepID=A0A8D0TAT5_PIG
YAIMSLTQDPNVASCFICVRVLLTTLFFCTGNGQTTGMVQLPGGRFQMGTNSPDGRDGEGPVREVTVKPFAIDIFPVTNKDFRYIRYEDFFFFPFLGTLPWHMEV